MRSATARTSSMLWRDHDDAVAAGAQPLDQVQDLGGLRDAERGGRLVEHDDLGVEQQRAGDGDGLALAARERGDRLAHARDAGGELGEQRPGADLHRHLVELPGVELVAEEEVGDDVEVLAEREVLVDGGDAERRGRRTGRPW